MKKSLTAMIFLLLALALCLVPSVGMLVHGPAEARANESAARAPELTGRDGALNADYLSELADYAGEGFYLRGELITLYARALALFGRSAEDGVVLGGGAERTYDLGLAVKHCDHPFRDCSISSSFLLISSPPA